jgi:hypothetical protein
MEETNIHKVNSFNDPRILNPISAQERKAFKYVVPLNVHCTEATIVGLKQRIP